MTRPDQSLERATGADGQPATSHDASDNLIPVYQRPLFDIVDTGRNETIGTHEDRGVAAQEAQRLDAEAATLGRRARGGVLHEIRERAVFATEAADDGFAPTVGPIVSSELVTEKTIKRADRPGEEHIGPG